tara:strand:+ start:1514 stop:2032 length:519 start_codon:yes stop_codon:yes gene_type:complete
MIEIKSVGFFKKIFSYLPIILLFTSVLNEFDFNYLEMKFFSFNFTYILIFYYSVKKSDSLGYGSIFIAGLFNDVVVGTPIGISSLLYLLICSFAAYLRNITLRPSLIKDWIFFLVTLLVINSFSYLFLSFLFSNAMSYFDLLVNTFFTFMFYLFFSYLFNLFEKIIGGSYNV